MCASLRNDMAVCGPAEPLFLVSTAWTSTFFTSPSNDKICNASLVDLTQGCLKCRQVVLRQGLEEDKDFVVVEAGKWAKLCADYGADYQICRYRAAAKPQYASRSAVKSESTKAERTKKAAQTKKKTKATAAPTKTADAQHKASNDKLPLQLFPEFVAVYYQDREAETDAESADAIIPCVHSVCGHPVRISVGHNASVAVLGGLARQAITHNMELDLATYEWLLPASHRGHRFDYLYYDRTLDLWTPSRFPNGQAALPANLTHVISSDASELKLCVCKRLTKDELVKYMMTVNKAKERLQRKGKRAKRKESDASDSDDERSGEESKAPASKRMKTKARRVASSDDEATSDEQEEAAGQRAKAQETSNEGDASNQRQAMPPTQPTQPATAFEPTRHRDELRIFFGRVASQFEEMMNRLGGVEATASSGE